MKTYWHGVSWGNPYTEPPAGLPRQLLSLQSSHHRPPEWFERKRNAVIDRLRTRGIYGYSITFDCEHTPGRKWSDEAKKRNRLRRLEKRLSKKYSIPQLLDLAIQEEINKKPHYYFANLPQ